MAQPQREGIAIVGIGCRFPGGVNDADSFWKLLIEGREAVSEVPADRWNIERFYDPEPGIEGKSMAKRGGFIQGIDLFDPQFFGISPREAPFIDPQQRLLLETAWEAMEDAGLVLDFERGTDLAVFVGISHNDYQGIQGTPWEHSGISAHSPTGSAHSIAANRVSYCFNLRGPSVAMDTACSSGLTAVNAACDHIWAGRGEAALAGAVTIMITPGGFIGFSQASMLSPDGKCKAFDASANGFVRGEGGGMLLLKRLSKALADGDPIYGVVIGSAMNQDGHTNGISLPSPEAQARLVRDACADAGIDPSKISFVEAHGTGTAVGDPIEAHALADALCTNRTTPLPIGSVKTNFGHPETAAGIAGIIKAALVLKHGQIPPSLNFETPNPHIDFETLKLRVPTALERFPQSEEPRMAGVNSFGFGGANSHVILAEPPKRPKVHRVPSAQDRAWPVMISARSEEALRQTAWRLSGWLEERLKANGDAPVLPDLVYTLGARRNHHAHRLTFTAHTCREVVRELGLFAVGEAGPNLRTAFTPRPDHEPRIAFVMSGQGPQWWGMGRELMLHEPVFRRIMEESAEAMKPWARFSLLEELSRDESSSRMSRTEIAQPAIFAMQVALAGLWKSWGILPAAIVGHSVGEVAAACVAGVLTLEQAAQVIVQRSRFMEECARGEGTMLAVGLSEEEARAVIIRHDRTVTISAFNGPRSVTLSGMRQSLEAILAELEPRGVFARLVKVDHPFHHALMQPAADALVESLAGLTPSEDHVPFFSTVTGGRCAGVECNAEHWGHGIRQPVQFAPTVQAMADSGVDVWLEISAHPALAHAIQECLSATGAKKPVLASARREREQESLIESALDLHRAGVRVDFAAMTPSHRLLSLPAYPWDKQRWWHESNEWREARLSGGGRGLLASRLPRATPTWSARLDTRHMAFLKDHKVENHIIFPAAGFVEMALEAGAQYFEGRPFVVEDFEIRKPLILPDPPSGLLLELSYDPNERTFAIQSRFDQGAAWSVHVVGSMRGERIDSSFATSGLEDAGLQLAPVEVTGFYGHMSDLGLRYGEEFRPIRELAAGEGQSTGRVALSDAIATRVEGYQLHPVLFDGALQIFSAGAATVEPRKAQLKLPVRFSRILFLRSPGASSRVRARVQEFSDDFIQGGIGLYDETGRPCVLVDGFRAISVAGLRRGGSATGRDIIYHIDWDRTPTESKSAAPQPPVPLDRLKECAERARDEVIALRGRDHLESAMIDGDALATAQLAHAFREMGVGQGPPVTFNADTLRVAGPMRAAFEQLSSSLVERGLLERAEGGYKPTAKFADAAGNVPQKLRAYFEKHPGHLPESLLTATACDELGPILRGEKEAVQVLFSGGGSDLLDQFYGDGLLTSHWLAAIAAAVKEAASHLPEGRGLRILEVGAGTGGLSAHVLPLLERGLHSYTFTDVSSGFFPAAMQKLSAFPEVECKIFDLERPGTAQGFEAGSYDLVIGTNVFHAVSDVRATLRHVHELLVPGGSLMFIDVATPQLWADAVFGLTSGWWRFTDHDLRTTHPLLQRDQWQAVMHEAGFSETTSLAGLHGSMNGESQMALLARKACDERAHSPSTTAAALPAEKSWIVFADEDGTGRRLARKLRDAGLRCRIVTRGDHGPNGDTDAFSISAEKPEDWKQLFESFTDDDPPERIVYMWNAGERTRDEEAQLMGTDALLHLAQALEVTRPTAKLRIDLVTRGAQPVGREMPSVAVVQAPVIGLLRVIHNEHPNYLCRGIDLPPTASGADDELLWNELLRDDLEREVAFRGEARYAPRIVHGRPTPEQWLDASLPLRLESRERGHLDTLRFTPFRLPECGPGQVLIDVKAGGMNFRDVLKALALYPGEAPDARIFGDEVAGVVKAVGAGVDHVAPGDRVFGLAVFGLATQTLARGGDVRVMPKDLSFDEAATLPVVFMTAWHALNNVARMRAGENILVHAGAGGVGMAAIQIAHHLGVEVIATAGSPAKRALLETLGVKHVIDSRRADFADAVMELTNGRGVDAVLNSLAGEAIPMGLSCLAEFGRFIEIGKRDIYQNSRIPLWPLRRNASFHVVAMDAVFSGDESLTRRMLGEITDLVEKGALHPLPFRSFPACRVDAAFRLMAQGKHIGKVVVAFPESFVPRRGEPLARSFEVKPEGSYLITGAFGGFGKVIAEWLVECGARHLVLTSRSGAGTPEAEAFVQKLKDHGVETTIVRADIGNAEDVTRLMSEVAAKAKPLLGVFHLAMTIDDAPLASLNRERMRTVMATKAYGALLLHNATRDLKLDCFVMFSSVSSIFGNPAQGNYAAANAFLDALAHHRHALGLPALTINWGALGGEGYVARNQRVAEFLAKQGTLSLTPGEVVAMLESLLTTGATQAMAIRVDWAKWRQSFRGLQENPMLERIFAAGVEGEEATDKGSDWRLKIESASPDEREAVIGQAVRDVVGSVLRVKPESLRDDQPLTDLGLDSLMGVEIENSLEAAVGIALPPTSLMRARTIGQIATLIGEHMGGKTSGATPAAPTTVNAPVPPEPAAEVDVDALSDEDIDRLLGAQPQEDKETHLTTHHT